MHRGELVIFDVGCELNHYASDMGRTFPVSGRFTDKQRQVLAMVTAVSDAMIASIRPGVTLADVQAAGESKIPSKHRKYMQTRHYFGHHIGLSVGDLSLDNALLEPGMIFTVEPWYYNHDEGIAVFVEDDVLVTAAGVENLTKELPRSPEALERMVVGPEPELLPNTPPGWRYERIEFPLSLAPELKYEGFEELSFAPGMFNAESETYFTYIFAMKITNDVPFDAKLLKSFLETYFRGLCRTVAKGTKFDIDGSNIAATVREDHYEVQHSRHFTVTLESYDPFVTGKPLKLRLEMLLVEADENDHRIFAAVSPKPRESSVWTLLQGFKREFQEQATRSGK